jgi:hypothetical protein
MLGSQESSLEAEKSARGKAKRRVQVEETGSEDGLNGGGFDGELEYPQRAYAERDRVLHISQYMRK